MDSVCGPEAWFSHVEVLGQEAGCEAAEVGAGVYVHLWDRPRAAAVAAQEESVLVVQ